MSNIYIIIHTFMTSVSYDGRVGQPMSVRHVLEQPRLFCEFVIHTIFNRYHCYTKKLNLKKIASISEHIATFVHTYTNIYIIYDLSVEFHSAPS